MRLLLTLVVLALATPLDAQEATPAASSQTLNVYLDCDAFEACDFDYHRTQISLVNWVRERQVADVHILVTTQQTGSGGTEHTATFIGLRRFAGMVDTLSYSSPPAASADTKRSELAKVFRMGLVRFLARTPAAARLTVTMPAAAAAEEQSTPSDDPWKAWVFRISGNIFANGEKTFSSAHMNGNLSANRVTENWKTRLSGYQSYNENKFEVSDTQTVVTIRRNYGGSLLQARSVNEHLSLGLRMDAGSSTFDNFQRVASLFPAVEYNFFPYSESTRRQLVVEYNLGYSSFAYRDTTIRDKIKEGMPLHRLRIGLATRQPWGSTDIGTRVIHYLSETEFYRIENSGELGLNLFKGFSLNIFGSYNIIQDQFYLSKKNFTPEEILTRQFQRGTTYEYWGGINLSYSFGSIYNNVVNPRFGGRF